MNICKYLDNKYGKTLCVGQKGAPQCYCNGEEEFCECGGYKPTDLAAYKRTTNQSPAPYNTGNIEVIDAILDWHLNFCLGNAVKYIARCEHTNDKIDDLKKAIWYLQREIEQSSKVE